MANNVNINWDWKTILIIVIVILVVLFLIGMLSKPRQVSPFDGNLNRNLNKIVSAPLSNAIQRLRSPAAVAIRSPLPIRAPLPTRPPSTLGRAPLSTISPSKSPIRVPLSPTLSPRPLSPLIGPGAPISPSKPPLPSPTISPARPPTIAPGLAPSLAPSRPPTIAPAIAPSRPPARPPSRPPQRPVDVTVINQFINVHPKQIYPILVNELGRPTTIVNKSNGVVIWENVDIFVKIILKDEAIEAQYPRPNCDFIVAVIKVYIPDDLVCTIINLSDSLVYDKLRKELTVRGYSLRTVIANLFIALLIINDPENTDYYVSKYDETIDSANEYDNYVYLHEQVRQIVHDNHQQYQQELQTRAC